MLLQSFITLLLGFLLVLYVQAANWQNLITLMYVYLMFALVFEILNYFILLGLIGLLGKMEKWTDWMDWTGRFLLEKSFYAGKTLGSGHILAGAMSNSFQKLTPPFVMAKWRKTLGYILNFNFNTQNLMYKFWGSFTQTLQYYISSRISLQFQGTYLLS